MNHSRPGPVGTQERDPSQNAPAGLASSQGRLDGLLVAEAVLKCHHDGLRTRRRAQQFRQRPVVRALDADDEQIAHAEAFRVPVDRGLDVKIPFEGFHKKAVGAHMIPVTAHQEVNIMSGAEKPRPVERAESTGAEDAYARPFGKHAH